MEYIEYNSKDSLNNSTTENQNLRKTKEGEKVLDLLIEIPLIKELSFTVIKQISHEFTKKYFKKNEYVIKQGEPINDIYLILKGSFVLTLNHYISYDVEPDIDTFIKYQNITNEPFNTDRNYEITGKIKKKEEIELFIYQKKYFFGDIEITSNKKNSLFNIKANEDNSIVCTMERKKWLGVIRKVREKFNRNTLNKLDMIQNRIKEILLKKKNLKFDKLKLNQDKIYYQLVVNNNYSICNNKINNINNNEYNNKINKHNKRKHQNRKSLYINNYRALNDEDKTKLQKSKSVVNLKSYQQKLMNLFKFPNILKNETRTNFQKFFDNFYTKKDKRKVKLTETKIDSEPIYLNKFKRIYNMTPHQKIEFLGIVKKYLDNNFKKSEYQTPKIYKKKSNIQELFTLYNSYINNSNENTISTNYSKNNIFYKTTGLLNFSLKNNLKNNSMIGNKKINKSFTPKQANNSIKLESKKNLNFGSLTGSLFGEKNKIKLKKIKFSSQIINYSNKNENNNFEINNLNKLPLNKNKTTLIKLDENLTLNKINKKRLPVNSPLNNKLFKNEKITTKTIFEFLLRDRCENVKNQILDNIGGEKKDTNIGFKININNNIDVRDEDYIKKLISANKFARAKSFNEVKFK